MQEFSIGEARANLAKILQDMEVSREEIILTRHGRQIAKITPCGRGEKEVARIGCMKGKISGARDFDVWPEDFTREIGFPDVVK